MDHVTPDHMMHHHMCYRFWSEWGIGFVMLCHHCCVPTKPSLVGDGADGTVRRHPAG